MQKPPHRLEACATKNPAGRYCGFFLVPKLCLGMPFTTAKLNLALLFVPKCNLGTSFEQGVEPQQQAQVPPGFASAVMKAGRGPVRPGDGQAGRGAGPGAKAAEPANLSAQTGRRQTQTWLKPLLPPGGSLCPSQVLHASPTPWLALNLPYSELGSIISLGVLTRSFVKRVKYSEFSKGEISDPPIAP